MIKHGLQPHHRFHISKSKHFPDFKQSFVFLQNQKNMEAADDGWRNEMRKYFLSIENLTEKALQIFKSID